MTVEDAAAVEREHRGRNVTDVRMEHLSAQMAVLTGKIHFTFTYIVLFGKYKNGIIGA